MGTGKLLPDSLKYRNKVTMENIKRQILAKDLVENEKNTHKINELIHNHRNIHREPQENFEKFHFKASFSHEQMMKENESFKKIFRKISQKGKSLDLDKSDFSIGSSQRFKSFALQSRSKEQLSQIDPFSNAHHKKRSSLHAQTSLHSTLYASNYNIKSKDSFRDEDFIKEFKSKSKIHLRKILDRTNKSPKEKNFKFDSISKIEEIRKRYNSLVNSKIKF